MKNKENYTRKNKIISIYLMRIMAFLIPTFITLFVIGTHSDYLIKKPIKIVLLVFIVICFLILGYAIFTYFKCKDSGWIKKNKKLMWFLRIILSLYILGCSTFLFLLYGPFVGFKDWLISTAMQTMHHQYYCKIFYSEDEIAETMANNYIIESGEDTNPELIDGKTSSLDNEYEKAILNKDYSDQVYKIIKFKVNGQDAYLAAVYYPERVSVGYTKWLDKWGQYVTQMAEDREALLAINGGGFKDINYNSNGQTPIGTTISNGKIITSYDYGSSNGGIIGLTENNVLVLLKNKTTAQAKEMGVRDAVTMGPFLVVNGQASFTKGNGGWGYAARTAIGQRKDGIILLLVVDSNETRSKGASMKDLADIMLQYGAVNAANLDGGTSSVMVLPKKEALKYNNNCTDKYCNINDPIDSALRHKTRPIATSWIVK